jgi:putative ABC transport system ATP-binding protein
LDSRNTPLIRIRDLWKIYTIDGREESAALRGADLDVFVGEIVLILGKSGSGKTTLFNLIAGLDHPTRGRIEVEGRDLESLRERGRTLWRRYRLGYIFQFFNLLPTLTAFENVFLSAELARKTDRALTFKTLRDVGLAGLENRFPHELSGGEQQRVAIARAVVKDPLLVLADEPTGNLDSTTGDQVLDLLVNRCRDSGKTLILASHAPLTTRHADRVLRIRDGRLFEESAIDAGPR